jgi:ferredoxin-type protein NapF
MANLARRNLFSRNRKSVQTLPWIKSHDDFIDACTRCNKCIEQCETNIIVKGSGGFPEIDFTIDECTFCYQCAQACPESLFAEQQQTPWLQKIVIDDQCLTLKKVTCRSCEDTCEPMAISFKAILGGPAQPMVEPDLCNGCGACIKPCPSNSIKMNIGNN